MVRKKSSTSSQRRQSESGNPAQRRLDRQVAPKRNSDKPELLTDRLQTSPDLFINGKTSTRMASALPIWEAGSILTQRKDLPWVNDPNGKLCYTKDVENGKGSVYFWLTEDLEHESPTTLAGAAALAVIDAFDIRAACMHLIYAAHATQLDRPWEQEIVIDDRQIEEYLGLKKRTDKNRQQKLALIKEIAQQPCKITTFISWSAQGKVKGFTLEEGRLWHLLGIRHHYQQDLFGNKELVGITFIIRPGLWARYFLNEDGRRDLGAYCQYGTLSKALLENVMSVWQHREGAARLMVWLLFKSKVDVKHPVTVQTMMEIAYGPQRIQAALKNTQLRKKLANTWDEDLLALHDRGWHINFHLESYPQELQPPGFGRENHSRPRGFFEKLLLGRLWISPPEDLNSGTITSEVAQPVIHQSELQSETGYILSGSQIRVLRTEKGWSQRKLSSLTLLSQGLISLIENNERPITPENQMVFKHIFEL